MVVFNWKNSAASLQKMGQQRWVQQLPLAANLLLLAVIANSTAQLSWQLLPSVAQPGFNPAMVSVTANSSVLEGSRTASAATTTDIAAWHLFGEAVAELVNAPVQEVVPETTLKLELRGILSSTEAALARAIIAELEREESSYAVGAAVPGGATLQEIRIDHVVLARGGRLETLRLPRESLEGVVGGGGNLSEALPDRHVDMGQDPSLSELRNILSSDPQSLMGLINARPEIVNGKVVGFKLDQGQDEQLLRQFGLMRGDVVTAVNDMRLDGVTNLPELLRMIQTAEQVKIEYKRGGRARFVTLNMNNN